MLVCIQFPFPDWAGPFYCHQVLPRQLRPNAFFKTHLNTFAQELVFGFSILVPHRHCWYYSLVSQHLEFVIYGLELNKKGFDFLDSVYYTHF